MFTLTWARDRAADFVRHNGPPPEPEPEPEQQEPAGPLTLGEFLKRFYVPDFEDQHPDPAKHLHNLKAFAEVEDLAVDDVTPLTIDDWLKKRLRAVEKSTARRNLAALKAALAWGHRKALVSADTLRGYRSDRLKGYDRKRRTPMKRGGCARLCRGSRRTSRHWSSAL